MRPARMNASKLITFFITPEHSGESFHRNAMCQLLIPARRTMAAAKATAGMAMAMGLAVVLTFLQ